MTTSAAQVSDYLALADEPLIPQSMPAGSLEEILSGLDAEERTLIEGQA